MSATETQTHRVPQHTQEVSPHCWIMFWFCSAAARKSNNASWRSKRSVYLTFSSLPNTSRPLFLQLLSTTENITPSVSQNHQCYRFARLPAGGVGLNSPASLPLSAISPRQLYFYCRMPKKKRKPCQPEILESRKPSLSSDCMNSQRAAPPVGFV